MASPFWAGSPQPRERALSAELLSLTESLSPAGGTLGAAEDGWGIHALRGGRRRLGLRRAIVELPGEEESPVGLLRVERGGLSRGLCPGPCVPLLCLPALCSVPFVWLASLMPRP